MTTTLYSGPHAIAATLFEQVESKVKEYTAIAAELAAADGDRTKAVEAFKLTSEDKEAVKLRAVIEKATTALQELAEKSVVVVTLSDEDKAKKTTELSLLRQNVSDSLKAIDAVNKSMKLDTDGVTAALTAFNQNNPTRLRKAGRAVGTANTGSNSPRTYVNILMTGGNLTEPKPFERFSQVASYLKTDVPSLQKLFAEAAGVDPSAVAGIDKDVTFTVKPHPNGAEYTIHTTPKPRNKPSKPTAETPAPAETPAQ